MSDTTHSDSHGPAHYFKIWRILIVLMLLSLGGPIIFSHTLTGNLKIALVLIVAFGVAIVKAYLVAKHFMHLPLEPKYIGYMLAGMIAFMLVLWVWHRSRPAEAPRAPLG